MTRSGSVSMLDLPKPSADAAAHSYRLQRRIAAQIKSAGGWIPFSEYMSQLLYSPGLGYYSAGAVKFGAQGDFVTASEISPLFARICAGQIDSALRQLGGGSVLEFGPGTGAFAAEALAEMARLATPLEEYYLLEISSDLRQRQENLVRLPPARWLNALPAAFQGVVFANEVLDAMPCERFVMQDGVPWRLGVGLCTGLNDVPTFEWRGRVADGTCVGDAQHNAYTARLLQGCEVRGIELPQSYCGEWHPSFHPWLTSLADILKRGVVLLVDYGLPRAQLFHPDRLEGSLRCHYQHYAHGDPFFLPGLCDVTAWVDFTSVAEAASVAGFQVSGFTTQMGFLLAGGLDEHYHSDLSSLAHSVRQLLLPGEMGESVKFLALTKNCELELSAFALQDLRRSL